MFIDPGTGFFAGDGGEAAGDAVLPDRGVVLQEELWIFCESGLGGCRDGLTITAEERFEDLHGGGGFEGFHEDAGFLGGSGGHPGVVFVAAA